jgi:CBS domain-containing protein
MQEQLKNPTTMSAADNQLLPIRYRKVQDLLTEKRRIIEVPYTATLSHTMNSLVAHKVVALPVAAPPGHWIGAGGSMIMETDKQTGVVRKHYIGMVTMLDILAHIADDDVMNGGDNSSDLDQKMAVPVSSIIGHSLEGLNLWTLNPNTSVLDCMEVFSKGIHRALVPTDSQMDNISGVELVESAPSYQMVTQMDLLKFLKDHTSELKGITSRSVGELGAVNQNVYAITDRTRVMDAIKCMRVALLNAVPIVTASWDEDHKQLINGRGRKLIGTFSSTDLRGSHLSTLQTWLPLTALEFTQEISNSPLFSSNVAETSPRQLVTCRLDSTLDEIMNNVIIKHVHRVWAVDEQGTLLGLVSLTDVISVIRAALLSDKNV